MLVCVRGNDRYAVRFFKGEWTTVYVDDRFPAYKPYRNAKWVPAWASFRLLQLAQTNAVCGWCLRGHVDRYYPALSHSKSYDGPG